METLSDVSSFMSKATYDSIKFKDKQLRRATPIARVLHCCGRIFESSSGNQSTFDSSLRVTRIDWFLSHNWDTPRFQKFAVLALFFNLRFAGIFAIFAILVGFTLTAYGILPLFKSKTKNYDSERGVYCTIAGPVVFTLLVFFGQDLSYFLCPAKGAHVFLDKTCIHQTDPVLKRQGIQSLAAFLHSSQGIAIVYTDLYLQKLWTIYEIASLMLVNPEAKIALLPTCELIFLFPGLLIVLASAIVRQACYSQTVYDALSQVGVLENNYYVLTGSLLIPGVLSLTFLLRWWAKKRANIDYVLRSFDIRKAKCFCEDDRRLVQGNVINFLRDAGVVQREASSEDALLAFNTVVQEELPCLMTALFGKVGIPYWPVTIIFLPYLGYSFDNLGAAIHLQMDLGHLLALAFSVINSYGLFPVSVALIARSSGSALQIERRWESIVVLCICLFNSLAVMSMYGLWFRLSTWAHDSMLFTCLHACHNIFYLIVARGLWRRKSFHLRGGARALRVSSRLSWETDQKVPRVTGDVSWEPASVLSCEIEQPNAALALSQYFFEGRWLAPLPYGRSSL